MVECSFNLELTHVYRNLLVHGEICWSTHSLEIEERYIVRSFILLLHIFIDGLYVHYLNLENWSLTNLAVKLFIYVLL